MQNIGVDGCRAGWLVVTRNGQYLTWQVYSTFDKLASDFSTVERVLIDIPIGLPWADVPIRPCDRLARQVLGKPRRSSVFPVPCREALAADGVEAARKINQAYIGRSIGAQTWSISPKIGEVDRFLLTNPARRFEIREVHPEVCFWALAGRNPMKHRKTTSEGRAERVSVLQHYEPGISSFLSDVLSKTLRKDVQADDVLDAAVTFVSAEARNEELASLAGVPSHDAAGLPIEMVYLRTWDEVA